MDKITGFHFRFSLEVDGDLKKAFSRGCLQQSEVTTNLMHLHPTYPFPHCVELTLRSALPFCDHINYP